MLKMQAKRIKTPSRLPFLAVITFLFSIPLAFALYKTMLSRIEGSSFENLDKRGIYINSKLPEDLKIYDLLDKFNDFELKSITEADLIISNVKQTENAILLERTYAVPVSAFNANIKNISQDELRSITIIDEKLAKKDFNIDFEQAVQVVSCDEIANFVKNEEIALVDLGCLDGSLSVLAVDGISFFGEIHDNYEIQTTAGYLEKYPLRYEVWASFREENDVEIIVKYIQNFFPKSEAAKEVEINSLVMTGVTAMGRAVLRKVEERGPVYPIEKVANVLKDADISHTSNEVSFLEGCIQDPQTMSFCALPESIETLKYAGIDIVEITGNHNNDKGWLPNLKTLEKYEQNEIIYVGGGKNLDEANLVKYADYGNYKIGFVGFNAAGPPGALANEERAGAAGYSDELLIKNVREAKQNADLVVVVIQWQNENRQIPTEFQEFSARLAIDNGADLVVGSQGHGAQKMEFYKNKPIFYALGNFIFDQMFSDRVREGVILRVNTIKGNISSLELLPYVIEDYCQPNFVFGGRAGDIIGEIIE